MRKWSENNIVIVSELQAPDDWMCLWEQEVSRSIKSQDKSKAIEKLFIHKSSI
jgi:DNA adenine methylase